MPSGTQGQLVPPWDPNGQMCLLPDGRFVVGLRPHPARPAQPRQRQALQAAGRRRGARRAQRLVQRADPVRARALQDAGRRPSAATRRRPPTASSTTTRPTPGCAVDKTGNVFGNDIATAQGDYPPPSSGRLVEWFAPNYTTYCIVYGPTTGGTGPHHTDGSGGLAQPGMMALADNGDLLVPNVGTSSVLRFAHVSLPTSAGGLPGRDLPPHQGADLDVREGTLRFPAGVAKDPTCDCFAVSSYIGNPVHPVGHRRRASPSPGRGTVPGTTIADLARARTSTTPSAWPSPPTGRCTSSTSTSCARALLDRVRPGRHEGRVMKVTFTDGQPGRAGGHRQRVRLPHQRDGVRPRHPGVPVSDGPDRAPRCRGRRRTRLPTTGRHQRPGHRRLRVSVRDAP